MVTKPVKLPFEQIRTAAYEYHWKEAVRLLGNGDYYSSAEEFIIAAQHAKSLGMNRSMTENATNAYRLLMHAVDENSLTITNKLRLPSEEINIDQSRARAMSVSIAFYLNSIPAPKKIPLTRY